MRESGFNEGINLNYEEAQPVGPEEKNRGHCSVLPGKFLVVKKKKKS